MTKRRLGQNFLFDPNILKRIVEAAQLSPHDMVVEIGPGPGRLTRMLASCVRKVIAIEVDRELYERLSDELAGNAAIELVHGDALRYPFGSLGPFKVVANIPYYITTPLLFKLFEHRRSLASVTIMAQREVAERIVASPGGKEYGVLSLMARYYSRPSLKFIVPKGAFRPVPKVDSALVHLEINEEPPVKVPDEKLFFRIIKTAFSQRRKTLSNALKPVTAETKQLLTLAGIDPGRRAETLSIEEFAHLAGIFERTLRSKPGKEPDG
jgi:16S rRNA (adenine1518-N6/adenine1519-N6)-dimethyltransferase